jgi:hypothetical protein
VVEVDELARLGVESVVFKPIVKMKDVVIGAAPDEVGDIVVRIVVTNCEALMFPLVGVVDAAASVRDAVAGEVFCCAWTASSPRTPKKRLVSRIVHERRQVLSYKMSEADVRRLAGEEKCSLTLAVGSYSVVRYRRRCSNPEAYSAVHRL